MAQIFKLKNKKTKVVINMSRSKSELEGLVVQYKKQLGDQAPEYVITEEDDAPKKTRKRA